MDLLSIVRKIWRYKLVTLPVLLLTLCGAIYVVAVKEPVYEASSSFILINPPAPPTAEDIARDPALGRINSDNPYTRFSDQSAVVEVLTSSLASQSAQRALEKAGADPRYTVAPTSEFGYSSPIVQITAQGWSPEVAVRSARLVSDAVTRQLRQMQQSEGVDPKYRIRAQQLDTPDSAQLRASGQLRMLVAVLALGAVLLFVAVSVADALTTLRTERLGRPSPARPAAHDEPWPAHDGRAEGLSALDPEEWSEFDEEPAGSDQLINLFPEADSEATVPTHSRPARQSRYQRKRRISGR
jgi:capsular polysaccharide biosynthesis protein